MRISKRVQRQAIELGVADTEEEAVTLITEWSHLAAICTHFDGNRRYGDYIFEIEDDFVINLDTYFDEDFEREGLDTGCEFCGGVGKIVVPDGRIPCPECALAD